MSERVAPMEPRIVNWRQNRFQRSVSAIRPVSPPQVTTRPPVRRLARLCAPGGGTDVLEDDVHAPPLGDLRITSSSKARRFGVVDDVVGAQLAGLLQLVG